MKRPIRPDAVLAKRLLVEEGAYGGSAEQCAAGAGRVYNKLNAQLALILGSISVEALFARSVKLASDDFPSLAEIHNVGSATKLREFLLRLDPSVGTETAVALFGTFLGLISMFIGKRLTTEIIRNAWPTIEGRLGEEKDE